MESRMRKNHSRAARNRQKRMMNLITLLFIICIGILILGLNGMIPLPSIINHSLPAEKTSPASVQQTAVLVPELPEITISSQAHAAELAAEEAAKTQAALEEQAAEAKKQALLEGVDVTKPMIALTFDDGPSKYTWDIMKLLVDHGGKATFFVVGNRVAYYNAALLQEQANGFEIANHSWSHPNLAKCSQDKIKKEITDTDVALQALLGETPTLLRPPYGGVSATVQNTVNKPLILWSVDTNDWKYRDAKTVADHVLKYAQDGDIVLMHDIHPSTAKACETIIPELQARGYQLVTVSQLYAAKGETMKPGAIYRGRTFTVDVPETAEPAKDAEPSQLPEQSAV